MSSNAKNWGNTECNTKLPMLFLHIKNTLIVSLSLELIVNHTSLPQVLDRNFQRQRKIPDTVVS